jgi:PTS system nitrogen regulatory IIA component
MSHRTLTLQEAADYLHLPPPDLLLLVKRNEIPHRRHGSEVVFPHGELDRWASRRLLGMPEAEIRAFHARSTAKEHDLSERHALIPELMRPSFIDPGMGGRNPPKIIRNLVSLAVDTGMVWDAEGLLTGVEEREALHSTALPGGFALLHPPQHEPYMFEDSFVVLGRSQSPVHFGAPGGESTRFFFLVCSQEARIHLHLLARLSMICSRTPALEEMAEAADAQEMFALMVAAETGMIQAHAPLRG